MIEQDRYTSHIRDNLIQSWLYKEEVRAPKYVTFSNAYFGIIICGLSFTIYLR